MSQKAVIGKNLVVLQFGQILPGTLFEKVVVS
jgi:hypothetical protein